MKMENVNRQDDLQSQMQALKSILEKQTIVNDKILRRAMNRNSKWISRKYIISIIACVLMVPYTMTAMLWIGFSLPFNIVTSLFFITAGVYTYYNMKALRQAFKPENSLIETNRGIARAKKMDADWLMFGIPFVIAWLGWFCYEGYNITNGMPLLIGGAIGGVAGGIAGFSVHFKIQRKYREIMENIEDITDGN